jgi:nucleotide-binding universal stress UspA family protein
MTGFSVILVTTDWHCPANEAMAVACALARRDARLIILPINTSVEGVPTGVPPRPTVEGDLTVRLEYIRRSGPPAEAIIDLAAEVDCELIVIGTRGASEGETTLLGRVAQEVLHRATCPVLCLPAPCPSSAGFSVWPPTEFQGLG